MVVRDVAVEAVDAVANAVNDAVKETAEIINTMSSVVRGLSESIRDGHTRSVVEDSTRIIEKMKKIQTDLKGCKNRLDSFAVKITNYGG